MIRNILSVIAGILSSFTVIVIVESIGHYISPMPAEVHINNPDAIKSYIETAPAIVFIMVILAYVLGSFTGGLIAALIATKNKNIKALTVGGILMGLGIFNLITIPHPAWVTILALSVFIPFAYLGGKLGEKASTRNT